MSLSGKKMKYMGSKSRIAKYIVPIIQGYIDRSEFKCYVEPFCGGCNVIDKIECDKKIAADQNKYLIALLQRIACGLPLLDGVSREEYSEVRDAYNNGGVGLDDWYIGNIGFLASYNGRFFDGGYAKPGYEKTKNGLRYRDYYQESKRNLLEQADSLKDIYFIHNDYRWIDMGSENVIYCDPPYANTKKYANSKNFDHDEFWQIMREWSKQNIVLISEESAPGDFECIWKQDVSRSIKAKEKSVSTEKLFIWKDGLANQYSST